MTLCILPFEEKKTWLDIVFNILHENFTCENMIFKTLC